MRNDNIVSVFLSLFCVFCHIDFVINRELLSYDVSVFERLLFCDIAVINSPVSSTAFENSISAEFVLRVLLK